MGSTSRSTESWRTTPSSRGVPRPRRDTDSGGADGLFGPHLNNLRPALARHLHGLQDVIDEDDAVVSFDLHASGPGNGVDHGIHLVVVDDNLQSDLLEQVDLLFEAAIPF